MRDYKVVVAMNHTDLAEQVKMLLDRGYIPCGGIQVHFLDDINRTKRLFQAMWLPGEAK